MTNDHSEWKWMIRIYILDKTIEFFWKVPCLSYIDPKNSSELQTYHQEKYFLRKKNLKINKRSNQLCNYHFFWIFIIWFREVSGNNCCDSISFQKLSFTWLLSITGFMYNSNQAYKYFICKYLQLNKCSNQK